MHIRYLSINYLFSLSLSVSVIYLPLSFLPLSLPPFLLAVLPPCSFSFPDFCCSLTQSGAWHFPLSAASHRQKFKLLPAITPGKSLRTVQLKRHVSKVGSVRTERSFACLCALLYLTIQIHRIPPWCSFNAASLAARGLELLLLTAVPHFPIQATHSTDGQQAKHLQNTLPRILMEHVTWWSLREPNFRDMNYPFTVLQFPKEIQRENLG